VGAVDAVGVMWVGWGLRNNFSESGVDEGAWASAAEVPQLLRVLPMHSIAAAGPLTHTLTLPLQRSWQSWR
jgi:hypothetical protein